MQQNTERKFKMKLAALMKEQNLTISQLSSATRLSFQTIQRYYNDNISIVNLSTLCSFCEYFDCGIEDLIEFKKKTC